MAQGDPVVIIWGGALQRAAYQFHDHLALTSEVRIEHSGVTYVAQGWYGGIFYCIDGTWEEVYYVTWYGRQGEVRQCLSYVVTDPEW